MNTKLLGTVYSGLFEGHESSRVPNDKIFLVNVKCKIFTNGN